MHIGKLVLAKHEGIVKEYKVIAIFGDQLKLQNEQIEIIRYFWEIRSVPYDKTEETK
jgi:hypothetical protein